VQRHIEGYKVIQVGNTDQLPEGIALYHPQAVICNVPPGVRDSCHNVPPLPVPFVECSLPSQAWIRDDLAVVACLTKPITSQQLLGEIDRLGSIRRILIVDDDRGFCQLVERVLQAAGRDLEVLRAYDGEEGLSAMRGGWPDLILLDLIMPGLDGFQVLEEMRRDVELADTPVILLTAMSYAEDALMRRGSQIVIYRPDQLRLTEVMRCLQVVIDELETRYDERSIPEIAVGVPDQ
jgi:CheY-like chemotaxis protein